MKERNQHPVIGDDLKLKFFIFNGKEFADPHAITKVEIYKLFSIEKTDENPFGRQLIETIEGDDIIRDDAGKYHVILDLEYPNYTQGKFQDEWHILFEENMEPAASPMQFTIFPNAWFTDTHPLVHDFNFNFTPNRIPYGAKKYISINVTPNVPHGTTKQRYYQNLVSGGDLYVYLEQICGDCVPDEQDLRLKVERELVTERDGCAGYYWLDTEELDCGTYNIWFELSLGPNVYISSKEPFQISK